MLPKPTIVGPRVLPPSGQAGWAASCIAARLGDKAAAYATEALEKQLTGDQLEREDSVPIAILARFGWERDPRSPSSDPRYFPPRDPRAGRVLLHYVEGLMASNADPGRIDEVSAALTRFATLELVEAVKAAQDRVNSPAGKERFSALVTQLQLRLICAERATTRPAEPDKPRLGPPPGWRQLLRANRRD